MASGLSDPAMQVQTILKNVHISLSNVHLRYEVQRQNPLPSVAAIGIKCDYLNVRAPLTRVCCHCHLYCYQCYHCCN